MHQELREDYLFLERMSDKHKEALEFTEPKVIELWAMITMANFSDTEIASLKVCNLILTNHPMTIYIHIEIIFIKILSR